MSSTHYASTLLAAESNEKFFSHSIAVGLLMTSLSSAVFAEDEILSFDIAQQRADLSLIEFAKQTNITLIFPFDEAAEVITNPLVGEYSIEDAVKILLANTPLKVKVSDSDQLTIITDQSFGDIDSMNKKNKLSSAVVGILSTLAGGSVVAQENIEEEVIVTGIRGGLQRAMDVKRESGGVVDAISAQDIGKFPDTNLAESLQRITGVSIDRSGGEGQLITVRGFGPQFNTVLINGRQIASENLSRAFSFDTLASELVSGIDVHKTSTATMQSGGVGSTVNIKTARPFDIEGFKVVGSAKVVDDENSGEATPQVSGLISYSDDSFGVLLSLSHQERETRLNQAQVDGWLENVGIPTAELNGGAGVAEGTTIFSPRNYDHKVTFEERTRTNANLVLQFAPSDNATLTADVLYSDFDIETDALSYGHWFTAPNIENATTDANGTVIDLYQERGLATDMHHKTFDRLTETTAFGLNYDWDVSDNLNLSFDLNVSNAEREPNNGGGNQLSLIGYANRVRFINDGAILPYVTDFAEANASIFSGQQEIDGVAYRDPSDPNFVAPAGVSDHLDESNSRAHVMLRRGWAVEDDVTQIKIDGTWNEDADQGLVAAKFGIMLSNEEKALTRWDNEGVGIHCTFCGYPDTFNGQPIELADQYIFDAGSDFLSDVSGSGRQPTRWLAHDGEAQFAILERQSGLSFDAVRRDNSFVVEEETLAAYLEFDFAGELAGRPISASAGVRIESTDTEVDGTNAPITGLTILDETEMLATFGSAEPVNVSTSYDAILPNMSVKWDISDDLVARAASSKTVTRPTLQSLSPVTVITTTRQGGDLTSTSGNPELEPFEADNFDLSLEWYYGDTSYASVGYFKKDVANFIVNTQADRTFTLADGSTLRDPSTGSDTGAPDEDDELAVFTNTLPSNGETATVDGFEVAVQHAFGESGFGVILNATLVDSDAELDPADTSQTFALTGLSDSYNLVGFYENGPFQMRLAYSWRDEFVQSLTQVQGDGPTIVEDYEQWDFSASYDVLDNVTLFLEGINLTEEFVHKRGRFDNQLLLVEDSGRRIAFGVRANF
ncbi:TonB-dependent receptor [Agarilytica rhodophyticola]|uniref:TonB-dependent receptor n=1 Tax=Agarilytica rhodophyticola TaxID=1737490 RepID=UPI001FEC41A6|nr:TonB-dependent receptor [Agarilytica rhodophyticola]